MVQESDRNQILELNAQVPETENLEKVAEYWRRQLAGASPASFLANPSATYIPRATESRKLLVQLSQHDREEPELTLSHCIWLAWAIVLGAYVESDDVVFGIAVTSPDAPVAGTEKMTGIKTATMPLRVRLDRKLTVQSALQSIQEQAMAMLPFKQTELQKIKRLVPEAVMALDFETLLVIQDSKTAGLGTFQALGDEPPSAQIPFAGFGLVIECNLLEDRTNVKVSAHVDSNLLDPAQTENIIQQFGYMLRNVFENPTHKLCNLERLGPADVTQLKKWNQKIPVSANQTLHDLIKERCRKEPMAHAVWSSDGEMLFTELDELSSRLARHLQTLDVKQDMILLFYARKSLLSAVVILGILKSGGACVSLDPNQPARRLDHIASTVKAAFMLVPDYKSDWAPMVDIESIVVTRSWLDSLPGATDLEWNRNPGSAAFIVFTSGSTGTPKGIVLDHNALASSILAHGPFLRVTNQTRMLQFASPAFDLYIYEHMTTLVMGGCICIPSEHEKMNEPAQFTYKSNANAAMITPTALRAIAGREIIPSIKDISLAGEQITPDIIAWGSSARIFNAYGPAECTICAAAVIDISQHPLATIGNSLGSVFWIVEQNDYTRLAPIGVIGELLIEGPVLARGYLNEPVKTALAFIEPPPWMGQFRKHYQGKIFRTGDLVKYNPDGSVVFVGRKDTQVKLRGYRIELGEIEYHLAQHFNGKEIAAEVIFNGSPDQAHLVAFVSIADAEPKNIADTSSEGIILPAEYQVPNAGPVLRELAETLPAYMVPSAILPVRQIPKTVSCKTDRKLLRQAAGGLSIEQLMAYHEPIKMLSPSTLEECLMQDIWAEVLRISPQVIGTDTNFFHLGGDSVSAMRLVSVARSKGRALTVANIFKFPKLSNMSRNWSSKKHREKSEPVLTPFSLLDVDNISQFLADTVSKPFQIQLENIVDVLPATDHQSWELQLRNSHYSCDLGSNVDIEKLLKCWDQLIQKYEILRTIFVHYQDAYFQVIVRHLTCEVEIYEAEKDRQEALIKKNIFSGPPPLGRSSLKIMLVRGYDQTRLVLQISHALYDGWSIAEIFRDWTNLFNGDLIPERPQYSKFVHLMKRVGHDGGYHYWSNLLRGSRLTSFKRPYDTDSQIGPITRVSSMRRVHGIVAPSSFTIATLIKAAWALVLWKLSSSSEVTMLQLTSGRRGGHEGMDSVIGPCISLMPVRVIFQEGWTGLDLCQYIQRQDVESMAYENIDLGRIIRHCTDWPTNPYPLGTIINHQNDEWVARLVLQNKSYMAALYIEPYMPIDIELETRMVGGNELEVEINSPSSYLGKQGSNEVINLFCSAAKFLLGRDQISCF